MEKDMNMYQINIFIEASIKMEKKMVQENLNFLVLIRFILVSFLMALNMEKAVKKMKLEYMRDNGMMAKKMA